VIQKNQPHKKQKKEISKLKNTEKVVIIPAPNEPIKRPKKPLINEPNNGKKTIFKYMFTKIKS